MLAVPGPGDRAAVLVHNPALETGARPMGRRAGASPFATQVVVFLAATTVSAAAGTTAAGTGEPAVPPPRSPVPSPRQLALLRQPVSAMAHFGIATFAGKDNPCTSVGCPPVTMFRPTTPGSRSCNIGSWVSAARALGARQICLTAHHGAGFTLWDSSLTNYSAPRSPYGADLLAQFASECRRQNVSICYYWDAADMYDTAAGTSPNALLSTQRGWLREVLANPVRKTDPSRHLMLKNEHFSKTGSGQI